MFNFKTDFLKLNSQSDESLSHIIACTNQSSSLQRIVQYL